MEFLVSFWLTLPIVVSLFGLMTMSLYWGKVSRFEFGGGLEALGPSYSIEFNLYSTRGSHPNEVLGGVGYFLISGYLYLIPLVLLILAFRYYYHWVGTQKVPNLSSFQALIHLLILYLLLILISLIMWHFHSVILFLVPEVLYYCYTLIHCISPSGVRRDGGDHRGLLSPARS